MKISCIHCKKDMQLEITNVLRQRIENRIEELKQSDHLKYIVEPFPSWIVVNELENLLR